MQLPEQDPKQDYEFVNHNSRKPRKKISPIVGGLVLMVGGAVMSYFFIYQKLQEMAQQLPSVSYSLKMIMMGPMLLIFGLYYLLIQPADFKEQSARDKKWLYIFVGIFIVAMILLYMWFSSAARGYGYSF